MDDDERRNSKPTNPLDAPPRAARGGVVTYKFRSEITRAALPTGYVDTSQVKREEVSIFLDRIYSKTKHYGGDWLETLIWTLLKEGGCSGWKPETLQFKAQEIYDDVQALMDVLIETKPTDGKGK